MLFCLLLIIGLAFSVCGLILFFKRDHDKNQGINKISILGVEAQLTHSALILVIIGAAFIILSLRYNVENHHVVSSSERNTIEEKITHYFSICKRQDYDQLKQYYTTHLDRYYSQYNVSSTQVVQANYDYIQQQKIQSVDYDLNLNSLAIDENRDGYTATFNLMYRMLRLGRSRPQRFDLKITMRFNHDYKISSIYEQILSRY